MATPFDLRRRRRPGPSKRQIVLIVVVVLIVAFLSSLRAIARLYTDLLWFHEVKFTSVWKSIIYAKFTLAVLFSIVAALFVGLNLFIARRLAPQATFLRPEEEAIRRFREVMRARGRRINLVVAVVVGIILGYPTYAKWQSWLMFRHAKSFNVHDAQFSRDVGFYVFKLPFISFVVDWLFGVVLFITIMMVVLHYLYGAIQVQSRTDRVSSGVRGHVSVLLGVLALIKALDYFLQRYELNFSHRGFINGGAGYTDVHAVLPALNFLVLVSAFAAILFFANVAVRRWSLPIIAVALWLAVEVLLAGVYPAFVQKVRVQPSESQKEAPYIQRNIDATRNAFALSGIQETPYQFSNDVQANDLVNYKGTLDNVRLWDPNPDENITGNAFQRLQGVRPFYQFSDTDVDRYTVNGITSPVVVSARELNPNALPSDTWENRQIAYTHGFGVAMAPYSQATPEGDPSFAISDIPLQTAPNAPTVSEPRVYFGDGLQGYVITNTKRQEIDYVDTKGTTQPTTYQGKGGVEADNYIRRAAFALRFGDINPLISSLIKSDSKFLYNRDIRLRVHTVAPFLKIDSDPYPVISNGRVIWVLDAYTTTSRYPYSSPADNSNVAPGADLGGTDFNYVRNSVKVTVDSRDGTTKLYVVDSKDPLLQMWRSAFPHLFTDGSAMPAEVRAHLRYPEDLFRVQSTMWSSFHLNNAKDFYGKSDLWNLSQNPGSANSSNEQRMPPYYVYMQVPGESKPSFVLMQSFVPASTNNTRRELVSFLVAKMDGDQYGKLQSFELPRESLPPGPADIAQRIQSDPTISAQQSLLNGGGSQAIQGNLLVLPIKNSFIYVQPWYVQGRVNSGTVPLPQLKRVAVVYGDKIAFDSTFQQSLNDVFGNGTPQVQTGSQQGTQPGSGTGGTTTNTPPQADTASSLLQQAQDAYNAAAAALKNNDLGTYQKKNDEAAALVARAQQLLNGSTTTTTPSK